MKDLQILASACLGRYDVIVLEMGVPVFITFLIYAIL